MQKNKTSKRSLSAADCMPNDAAALSILRARAKRLAKPAMVASTQSHELTYVRFGLGTEDKYGIPYQYAKEVMNHVKLTPLICVPDFIAGIINRRGSLLTVLDLQSLLFKQKRSDKSTDYIIVIALKDLTVGVLADAIDGSAEYDPGSLDASVSQNDTDTSNYILGIDKGTTAILNVEALLSNPNLLIKKSLK